jgi:hypothetical protein
LLFDVESGLSQRRISQRANVLRIISGAPRPLPSTAAPQLVTMRRVCADGLQPAYAAGPEGLAQTGPQEIAVEIVIGAEDQAVAFGELNVHEVTCAPECARRLQPSLDCFEVFRRYRDDDEVESWRTRVAP